VRTQAPVASTELSRQRLTIDPRPPEPDSAEPPPLGSWTRLYAIVVGELALLILLFTLFARAFA
jgi:hypothetical protein